ncbi:hypothetical protein MKQ70_27120 [Chitinophaga sedimenti]|uniref:hypothetical protein n=1 Tax=Chitinophaga sedimenti TaxID=2033606 RepID=UPI002005915E|nr:hypothetical protein [Chitinophaga sedimenti]MCK7558468.1 hypothetical protein [Chitinophaga sedimenti]
MTKIIKSPVLIVLIVALVSMSWFTYKIIVANHKAMECGERVQQSDEKMRLLHTIYQQNATLNAYMTGFQSALDKTPAQHPAEHVLSQHVGKLRTQRAATPHLQQLSDSLVQMVDQRITLDRHIRNTEQTEPAIALNMLQDSGRQQLLQAINDVHGRMVDEERRFMDQHISNHRFFAGKVYNLSLVGSGVALLFLLAGIIRFVLDYTRSKKPRPYCAAAK